VVAKIIGNNVFGKSAFVDRVSLYVHDEVVEGKKLSEIINLKHENTKYLPGCKLPNNVVCSAAFGCFCVTLISLSSNNAHNSTMSIIVHGSCFKL